ncbi:MAG: hypothetical protein M3176_00995 [Chloroflexota bacterium]|nr:hypothetical protein [Chloroflexota bacterium]
MGVIRHLNDVGERMRITRFRIAQDFRALRPDLRSWQGLLLRHLLLAVALLVAAIWIDRALTPRLFGWLRDHIGKGMSGHALSTIHPADPGTLIVVVTTDVAVAAGVAAIVIGASMVLLDSAAQRYPASAVDYLAGERSRGSVVSLLALAMTYSLICLLVRPVGLVAAAVSVLLTLLGIVALVRYLTRAVALFHPTGLSRHLVADVRRRIAAVATSPAPGPGRSVAHYLRLQSADDFARLDDLLTLLGEEKRSREAGESIGLLGALLHEYLAMRRRIPAGSMWFPLRDVALGEDEVGLDIRRMHEALGIGVVQGQKQDTEWFERTVIGILGQAATAARSRGDHHVLHTTVDIAAELMTQAWRTQEIVTLRDLLDLLDRIERDAPDYELETLGMRILETRLQVADAAAREGFALAQRRSHLNALFLSSAAIYRLSYPTILQRLCLGYQERLAMERTVAGKQITPQEWVERRLAEQFREAECDNVRTVDERVTQAQQASVRRALTANLGDVAGQMFAVGPQLCTRLIVHNRQDLARTLFPVALENLSPTLDNCADKEIRAAILTQLRVPTLQAIARQDIEFSEMLIPALVKAIVSGIARAPDLVIDGTQIVPELEYLLALGGLAYLASQFTQDERYLAAVKCACVAGGLALSKVAGAVLPLLDDPIGFGLWFGNRLAFGYNDVFQPYLRAIGELPEVADDHGSGGIPYDVHPDHPSIFIQRAAPFLQYDDCVEAFLKDVVDTPTATGEETEQQHVEA